MTDPHSWLEATPRFDDATGGRDLRDPLTGATGLADSSSPCRPKKAQVATDPRPMH